MKRFLFPHFSVRSRSEKNTDSGPVGWIIAGLGNPGREYEHTRHNVGFMTLDYMSEKHSIPIKRGKFKGLYGLGEISGARVMLIKPQTYMNLSGECLRDSAAFYNVPIERLLVIFDDISLPTGTLRLRKKGSDGGHNGIKSIIYQLQSDQFPRVKVGVGSKPYPDADLRHHVLSSFPPSERGIIADTVISAAAAVESILKNGMEKAMNDYN